VSASALRLALCLLPVVAASAPSFAPGTTPANSPRPYLAVLGPPPLRFADAIPPPDLSVRPAVGAPPVPTGESTGTPVTDITETPAETPGTATLPAHAPDASVPESTAPLPSSPETGRTPAPILVDDTRPRVKTEDFLPFFVFPAQGGAPQVVVPASAVAPAPGTALPASSATYRQQ